MKREVISARNRKYRKKEQIEILELKNKIS